MTLLCPLLGMLQLCADNEACPHDWDVVSCSQIINMIFNTYFINRERNCTSIPYKNSSVNLQNATKTQYSSAQKCAMITFGGLTFLISSNKVVITTRIGSPGSGPCLPYIYTIDFPHHIFPLLTIRRIFHCC